MSEDEPVEEPVETPVDEAKTTPPGEDGNRAKYRLISGEDILENGEARPSTLAFLGMYVLGLLVFGIHLFFNNPPEPATDASFLTKLAANLIEWTNWESLPLGFVLLMCFVTWANRMLNISTSGRWVTLSLLFITFLPIIISVDNLISAVAGLFGAEDGAYDFIPIDNYNFFLAGLVFLVAFWGFTFKYQRSFSYAVTTNAIIFQHAFLLSRSHRRILFDRISEVMVERTPMGTLLGYATVTIMTDSGVGLVEESVGVGAGATGNLPGTAASADDSPTAKASKGIFRSIFAFISYQRTTRRVDHDPRHCFYKIRKWEDIKMMLNEMHRKHSQSNMLEDIKSALTAEEETEA
ncbi:MAG: PH domain-containing protein [Candidatus Thermoplasmatota archaeon]|nr:PH domain-containing protein [Candidatus Thermoplasmatota archaeon]|tara:strand:- start:447 stop:1499 length:1053 start_codon:yes stop_codon:yes gene_type:complete